MHHNQPSKRDYTQSIISLAAELELAVDEEEWELAREHIDSLILEIGEFDSVLTDKLFKEEEEK